MPETRPPSYARKLAQLALALACIWVMVWHVCPAIIEAIPSWKKQAALQDELNIMTSALFYNDLEITTDAELHTRHTIMYPPNLKKGPAETRR